MDYVTTGQTGLLRAAAIIKKGGIVVMPTDTAYGLAAHPAQAAAVKRLLQIKGRAAAKAVPWVAASVAQVRRHFRVNAVEQRLMIALWPGPLSLVLKKRRGRGTVAIRVPGHPVTRALCRLAGHPLTATSANRSGHPPCYSPQAIKREFRTAPKPDAFINAGVLPRLRPSTIVELKRGRLIVHRPGPISLPRLKRYV